MANSVDPDLEPHLNLHYLQIQLYSFRCFKGYKNLSFYRLTQMRVEEI